MISIHALREEGDGLVADIGDVLGHFYPRPPRGGRLGWALPNPSTRLFLSTPSARRATTERKEQTMKRDISIHALREEGDHCHGGL